MTPHFKSIVFYMYVLLTLALGATAARADNTVRADLRIISKLGTLSPEKQAAIERLDAYLAHFELGATPTPEDVELIIAIHENTNLGAAYLRLNLIANEHIRESILEHNVAWDYYWGHWLPENSEEPRYEMYDGCEGDHIIQLPWDKNSLLKLSRMGGRKRPEFLFLAANIYRLLPKIAANDPFSPGERADLVQRLENILPHIRDSETVNLEVIAGVYFQFGLTGNLPQEFWLDLMEAIGLQLGRLSNAAVFIESPMFGYLSFYVLMGAAREPHVSALTDKAFMEDLSTVIYFLQTLIINMRRTAEEVFFKTKGLHLGLEILRNVQEKRPSDVRKALRDQLHAAMHTPEDHLSTWERFIKLLSARVEGVEGNLHFILYDSFDTPGLLAIVDEAIRELDAPYRQIAEQSVICQLIFGKRN